MRKYYFQGKEVTISELRQLTTYQQAQVEAEDADGNRYRPFRLTLEKSKTAPFGL